MRDPMRTHLLLILGLFLTCPIVTTGQSTAVLYTIHNPSPGIFSFGTFDLATGVVTDLEAAPITTISSMASACVDVTGGLYHFCDGKQIHTFDMNSVTAVSTMSLGLGSLQNLFAIEWDPCEQVFLGVLNAPPDSIVLVRFDPGNQQFTTLAALSSSMSFCSGCQGMFDPVLRRYMLRYGGGILTLDPDAGAVLFDVPMVDPPGFTPVHHLSYSCAQQRIVGTAVGTSPEGHSGKFLFEVEETTGATTMLTTLPASTGLWKPALGNSCIDDNTGTFYWSGVDGMITGADISIGTMTYAQQASSDELFLIEHATTCACTASNMPAQVQQPSFLIYPNPAADMVNLVGKRTEGIVSVHDHTGRAVWSGAARQQRTTIPLQGLAPGHYVVRLGERAVPLIVAE